MMRIRSSRPAAVARRRPRQIRCRWVCILLLAVTVLAVAYRPGEDHRFFFVNDEFDEQNGGHTTRTLVFDTTDLTAVALRGFYSGPTTAVDHNLYVDSGFVYESNYTAGLRMVDATNAATPSTMTEAAFFDVHPADDDPTFNGTWANYPFFESGTVIVNSIERGLFVLRPSRRADIPRRAWCRASAGYLRTRRIRCTLLLPDTL